MNTDKRRYKNRFQISDFRFQISDSKQKIFKKSVSICVHLWLISLCIFTFSFVSNAQVRPIYDQGATGLGQLLKRLNNTKSVMMIGAHPDDEDSSLLAFLARGENARTAYLSLTRGDGGQNVIGSELFESLGVIRTEELLQARRLDGAEQLFTRAFDYGFSKTLAEAKEKWDEKEILCDTVQAIRTFRPLVVISRFSGTPADGHGQHQYAGYISPLAVKAAADENVCKDSGAAWKVLKFYVEQGFRSTEEPTLKINTGKYDFLLGRSYAEIAAEGRSQHKTQEQGGLELKGDRFSGLNLVESKVPKVANETGVFDGIDTSIAGAWKIYSKNETAVEADTIRRLGELQKVIERTEGEFNPFDTQKVLRTLIEGKKTLIELERTYHRTYDEGANKKIEQRQINESDLLWVLSDKGFEFDRAVKLAAGIRFDALADREMVAQGEDFSVAAKLFYPPDLNVHVKEFELKSPFNSRFEFMGSDLQIKEVEKPENEGENPYRREKADFARYYKISVGQKAEVTQPYWLIGGHRSFSYYYGGDAPRADAPVFYAQTIIEIEGAEIYLVQPVEYRYADGVRGEVRRDVDIVPPLSVSLDQTLLVASVSNKPQKRRILMSVTNNSSSPVKGITATLGSNSSVPVIKMAKTFSGNQAKEDFDLKPNEKIIIPFDITFQQNQPDEFYLDGTAKVGGIWFSDKMNVISYPHIKTHRFYTKARTKVEVLDLKVADVKVGYIMGSGDTVPEAIRQMGLNVELLNENDLINGKLSRFDVIVVGIRAYNVRQDLISNNKRVLDYVGGGGTLIVQYQRPDYVENNLAPFPAKMAARVVDENAKVTILEPNSPVFNFPNKIINYDWANWVQERNLYSFTEFDAKYKPLLESHDINEPENKGGMVYAEFGKGKYIYTSYAFFRQLPAGVPGAYRLFANLLSLPKK